MTRIPVTILGGYLGAGKTTLINRVLAEQTGGRLAVFVNDFGEINIDAALVESRDENVVALTNGCVCCSIGDDLGKALYDLLQSGAPTDHILIEASGAADPKRVAGYAMGDQRLSTPHVITLADVETVRMRAKDKFVGKLVQRQIKAGDMVALSKTDLIGPAQTEPVRQWIETLAPKATILDTADLSQILIGSATGLPSPSEKTDGEALPHFTTFAFETERPLDRARFQSLISNLPNEIWRAKGFVCFRGDQWHVFQKVGARIDFSETDDRDKSGSAIVFIAATPAFDSAGIIEKLHDCCEN